MQGFVVVGFTIVTVGLALNKLWDFAVLVVEFHFLDLQLMDLHLTSCGICLYLANLWLILGWMIVVEHAGINISYWVSSSKSFVGDCEGFSRMVQPVNTSGRNQLAFSFNFCFELTAWNPFSSNLPLPPKSLVDKRRMIVVKHVEIFSFGICNCSWWTCIEQIVRLAVLVVSLSVLGLAVDGLALNKLWDLPLPPISLVDSKKNHSCGTCRDQYLLLSFIIQVFGW